MGSVVVCGVQCVCGVAGSVGLSRVKGTFDDATLLIPTRQQGRWRFRITAVCVELRAHTQRKYYLNSDACVWVA